jgi:hypothetical protein
MSVPELVPDNSWFDVCREHAVHVRSIEDAEVHCSCRRQEGRNCPGSAMYRTCHFELDKTQFAKFCSWILSRLPYL